jgi:hypothetical protein
VSLFNLREEQDKYVRFDVLISELYEMEGAPQQEVCRIIHKIISSHARGIESATIRSGVTVKTFGPYSYQQITVYDWNKNFESEAEYAFSNMAQGVIYEESKNKPGIWVSTDGKKEIEAIYFKGQDVAESLLTLCSTIPPCLDTFRQETENTLSFNSDMKSTSELGVNNTVTWDKFHGKETALMMIAGLAIALESSGIKYSRGGKINKLAIAEAARKAINDHGKGTEISSKALTDLIKAALDMNLPDEVVTSKN